MTASQSYLSGAKYGYDFVVATTQGSLNATMKEYLSTVGEPEVVVCYVADQNGHPTAIDYAQLKQKANGSDPFAEGIPDGASPDSSDFKNLFTARFMFGFKAKVGLPRGYAPTAVPDVIGLSADASSVSYTLMCSEFIVAQLTPGSGYGPPSFMKKSQPTNGNAWLFKSKVDLRLEPYGDAFSKLPPAVQATIKNLGSDAFSVQQLLFDLDNAALETPAQIQGVDPSSDLYRVLQNDFLDKYISTVKQNGQPVLGCAVTPKPELVAQILGHDLILEKLKDPSLILTDFDFQVSPFLGSDGQPLANPTPEQKDLVTLDYLCATGGRKLPAPTQFGWNWMEAGDEENFDGIIAINRDALVRYFDPILTGFARKCCFQPKATVTTQGLGVGYGLQLTPQMPTVDRPTSGSKVLGYSYSASSADKAGPFDCYQLGVGLSYSMDVTFIDNTIIVSQHFVAEMMAQSIAADPHAGSLFDITITDTYTIDVDAQGRLVANLKSSRTDNATGIRPPLSADFEKPVIGVINMVADAAGHIVSSGVKDIPLSFAQNFVFPGGKTFVFKDARFSANQDLVAHITYADPT